MFDVVINDFADLAKQLHNNADTIARSYAGQVKIAEQQLVPVDSGDLYDSIRVEKIDDGHYDVIAGNDAEEIDYAPHVNYGTHKQAAQNFVESAAEPIKQEYISDLRENIL